MTELSVAEISRRAKSGPVLLIGRKIFAGLISLASTITIARLLSPRDYGLAAVAAIVIAMMQVFRDFGLSNALLRKGKIEKEEVNFLFWFNMVATLAIALVIALTAPVIGRAMNEAVLPLVIWVSLIGFVIEGVFLQHNAMLKRDLRFNVVATAEVTAMAVGFAVGLTCAYIWKSVWALVAMNITQSIIISLITVSASRWMPQRPRLIPNYKDLLLFGANSTAFSLLNYASRNSGSIIIGYLMGTTPLGYFNRASALFQLPISNLVQPIAQVALPVMTRLRIYPELYRKNYLSLVQRLCCLLFLVGSVLTFAAAPFVEGMLGAKWHQAGEILAVLAPALGVYGLMWPTSDLLISQNRGRDLSLSGVYDLTARAGGTLIGAHFAGLLGAGIGLSVGTVVATVVRVHQAGRVGPVSIGDQWRAFMPSLPIGIGAAVASAAAMMIGRYLAMPPLPTSILIGVIGVAGGMAAGVAVRPSRMVLLALVATLTGRHKVDG